MEELIGIASGPMPRTLPDLLNDLLDEEVPLPCEEVQSLPRDTKKALADFRLLHLLLNEYCHPTTHQQESRIQWVMQAILQTAADPITAPPMRNEEETAPGRTSILQLLRWWIPGLSALLVLLLSVVWWTQFELPFSSAEESPQAIVEEALAHSLEPIDHRFRMEVHISEAAFPVDATLYARGNQYVMQLPGLWPGGTLTVGTNGKQGWFVPAIGPVKISEERGFIPQILHDSQAATPFLEVHTAIQQMITEYELEILEPMSLPSLKNPQQRVTCQRVRGVLREPSETLPSRMELWAEDETGATRKIHLYWDTPRVPSGWTELHLELVESPVTLPEDWYQPSAHETSRNRIWNSVTPFERKPGSFQHQ